MRKRIFTVMAILCSLVAVNAADVNVLAGEDLATKIGEAAGSGTVRVQVGTYVLSAELTIPSGVTVIGGYDDSFDEDKRIYPGAATSKEEMTILDGNSLLTAVDQKHRVAEVSGILEGVVIRNGHVRNGNGGGVLINDKGTVQNCIIKGNVAMNVGGTNDALGGGVYLNGTDAKLINCVVAFNMANNGYGVAGTGQVINNTITANTYAPVAIAVDGNVGKTAFKHYSHYTTSSIPLWSKDVDGFDSQELYFTDFSIAQTQTTTSQFAVFVAAMDLTITDSDVFYADPSIGEYRLFQVNDTYGLHASTRDFIYRGGCANQPMAYVSWYGAKAYCEWIGGALPTEGQWEYAARNEGDGVVNEKVYAGSDDRYAVACFKDFPGGIQEVATKTQNGIGLYDMSGNVWEWCEDYYETREVDSKKVYPNYGAEITDPVYKTETNNAVLRGGTWNLIDGYLTLAYRHSGTHSHLGQNIGFRPVLVP